jgi:hypothetical protein
MLVNKINGNKIPAGNIGIFCTSSNSECFGVSIIVGEVKGEILMICGL